jgi:hypothetical protein
MNIFDTLKFFFNSSKNEFVSIQIVSIRFELFV